MKAIWNNKILAESDDTVVIEGNHYFPPDSVRSDYFKQTDRTTTCPWKGEASYYSLVVDGEINKNAAWTYRDPKDAASEIKDHVAFWKDVTIKE